MSDYLRFKIEQSPAIALLRSDQAGFIIDFFQSVFGETQRFQMGYNELVIALGQYNEEHGNLLTRKPSDYIEIWADEKHCFLRKYYVEGNDEPQTELAYEVSSAMAWLRGLGSQDFVGAESRVSGLFQMIDKLASHSDTDPKARIAKLQSKRDEIDQEISQIKKRGMALDWDDLRKREYLSHIIEDSRRLFADFSLIEDIFKDQARQLKEKMISAALSKGEILEQVLDMHDALEESDQRKSFRSFWNFLMSSSKQEELGCCLDKILRDLSEKPYLKGIQHREYLRRLKGFKADLLQRGRKVLASQNRLTREIRNLLVQHSHQDCHALKTAISDIKIWCITHRENFANIASDVLLEIEHTASVNLPLERPLWSKSIGTTLDLDKVLDESSAIESKIDIATGSQSLALWQLEERVSSLLQNRKSLTLPEILKAYPLESVLEELVGYLAIGMKDREHAIDKMKIFQIDEFTLPWITFCRPSKVKNNVIESSHVKITN